MPDRSKDWLKQAERDLEQAKGQDAWGHVVATLLAQLPVAVPPALIEKARVLDNFYVATRYVNGHPAGAPFEHYGPLQSAQAIEHAAEIIQYARTQVA